MMKDCNGREVKVGDQIGFTVGADMKTGEVVMIKDRRDKKPDANYSDGWGFYAKVRLHKPEDSYIRNVKTPKFFRNVEGAFRITLLKPIDNSEE